MYYLCIGYSHIHAARHAENWNIEHGQHIGPDLKFVDLVKTATFDEYFPYLESLTPEVEEVIAEAEGQMGEAPAAVFFSIGGNHQHTLGMLNLSPAIDVIPPWKPNAPLNAEAQVVPYRMLERLAFDRINWKLRLLGLLSKRFDCPKFFFQFPPPIVSGDHIQAHASPELREMIERQGISPLAFRLKVATIHSHLYESACERSGIKFLYAPPEALTEEGALRTDFANTDSIHGSAEYGQLLIQQMHEAGGYVRETVQ